MHLRLLTLAVFATLALPSVASARAIPVDPDTGKPVIERQSRRTIRREAIAEAAKRDADRLNALQPLKGEYTNAEFGVSIRYPEDWDLSEELQREENLTLVVMLLSPQRSDVDVRENTNLVVEDIQGDPMTLDQYTQYGLEKEKAVFDTFSLVSDTRETVAGFAAERVVFNATANFRDMRFEQVWFIRGNQAYVWTFADDASSFDANVGVFERMLGTLEVR